MGYGTEIPGDAEHSDDFPRESHHGQDLPLSPISEMVGLLPAKGYMTSCCLEESFSARC